jgi:hypothetical protein
MTARVGRVLSQVEDVRAGLCALAEILSEGDATLEMRSEALSHADTADGLCRELLDEVEALAGRRVLAGLKRGVLEAVEELRVDLATLNAALGVDVGEGVA